MLCHIRLTRFLSIREYRHIEPEKTLKEALITWSPAMIRTIETFFLDSSQKSIVKKQWKDIWKGVHVVRKVSWKKTWSWKVWSRKLIEVGNFSMQYNVIKNCSTSARTSQLHSIQIHLKSSNLKISNFQLFPTDFPISNDCFEICPLFPTFYFFQK